MEGWQAKKTGMVFVLLVVLSSLFSCSDTYTTKNRGIGGKDIWSGKNPKTPLVTPNGIRKLPFEDNFTTSHNTRFHRICREHTVQGKLMAICLTTDSSGKNSVSCYIDDSADDIDQTDFRPCSTVYPRIGGEKLTCQAGIFFDSKALKCNDNWGVVLQGQDLDSQNLCRIYLAGGSGFCMKSPKEQGGLPYDTDLSTKIQRTTWNKYPVKTLQIFGVVESTPPENLPPNHVLSYTVSDTKICTIDKTSGTLTGSYPGTCIVSLTVSAEGFVDRFFSVSITVSNEISGTHWTGYPSNTLQIGQELLPTRLINLEPTSTLIYTTNANSICRVINNEESDKHGAVSGVRLGQCTITLTILPIDGPARRIPFVLTVEKNRQDPLAWPLRPYGRNPMLVYNGPQLSVVTPPTGGIGELEYRSRDYTVCTAGALDGTLTPVMGGTCIAQARWTGNDETEASQWVSFAPIPVAKVAQSALVWPPDPYGPGAALSYNQTLNIVTPPTGGGIGVVQYRSITPGQCTVDGLGSITGRGIGNCVIEARWSGDRNTEASPLRYQHTHCCLQGLARTLIWPENAYGNNPVIDGILSLVIFPTGGLGSVQFRSQDNNVCVVDSETGDIIGVRPGTCNIEARWSGDDNTEPSVYTAFDNIPVRKANQNDLLWPNNPYGANPILVYDGPNLNIVTAPTGGVGNLEYRTKNPNICSINQANGIIVPNKGRGLFR